MKAAISPLLRASQRLKRWLTNRPREMLIVVFIIGFIAVLLLNRQAKYLAIPLADISSQQLYIHKGNDSAYLIIKMPRALLGQQNNKVQNKNPLVSDPPHKTQPHPNYRVLALQYRHGYYLLPSNRWWHYHVPCIHIRYIPHNFYHHGQLLRGGFKCDYSASEAWADKLLYNLQGESLSPYLANLYTPLFHIKDGELRIGSSRSE